MEIERW